MSIDCRHSGRSLSYRPLADRARLEEIIERALALLDALDAAEQDLEPETDEDDDWEGSVQPLTLSPDTRRARRLWAKGNTEQARRAAPYSSRQPPPADGPGSRGILHP